MAQQIISKKVKQLFGITIIHLNPTCFGIAIIHLKSYSRMLKNKCSIINNFVKLIFFSTMTYEKYYILAFYHYTNIIRVKIEYIFILLNG